MSDNKLGDIPYPRHICAVRPKEQGGGCVYVVQRSDLETVQYIITDEQFKIWVDTWRKARQSELNSNIEIARVMPQLPPGKLSA